jgi:hypothetical protein
MLFHSWAMFMRMKKQGSRFKLLKMIPPKFKRIPNKLFPLLSMMIRLKITTKPKKTRIIRVRRLSKMMKKKTRLKKRTIKASI